MEHSHWKGMFSHYYPYYSILTHSNVRFRVRLERGSHQWAISKGFSSTIHGDHSKTAGTHVRLEVERQLGTQEGELQDLLQAIALVKILMVINGDLMSINGDLMVINGDFMLI